MRDTFAQNLAILTARSPAVAHAVQQAAGDGFTVGAAATGDPIVEWQGRALDSRRDPVRGAAQQVADVTAPAVVVFGVGGGYVVDALLARGVQVGALVAGSAGELRAALSARPLERVLSTVPVFLLDDLRDRVTLALLRGLAPVPHVHAPSVTVTPALGEIVARWSRLRAPRQPRVLVVGPVAGGSVGTARYVAEAVREAGAETRFFDPTVHAAAHRALGELPVDRRVHDYLRGSFMLLLGEACVEVARTFGPDLVIALAQAPLAEPALARLRRAGVPAAFWFVENHRVLTYWRDVAPHYDVVYAIQPGTFPGLLVAAGAARAAYLPMACAPAHHRPITLTQAEQSTFGADVSFAGAPYLNRRHVLASVADLGLRVWGDGWQHTTLAGCAGNGGAAFDAEDMRRIACATKVNINLHSAAHTAGLDPTPDYVNPRTFEIAACGAFQLVDAREPLGDLFAGDEMVTFRSPAELRRLAEHFLAQPEERVAIAARARARVQRDHTYLQRVRQIFQDTLAPELVAGTRAGTAAGIPLDEAIGEAAAGARLTTEEALLRMVADVRDTVRAL